MKPVAYIETTVVSYRTAKLSRDVVVAGHQVITLEWWEKDLPKFQAVISPIVLDEAASGDPEAAAPRLALIGDLPVLALSEEVRLLARRYHEAMVIPAPAQADALHVALATVHGVDYLVTWNCRHLANGRVRRLLQDLNESLGLGSPEICTPEELLEFSP